MNIEIKYNGEYPDLCSGTLIVIIDEKEWIFPDKCLLSGGSVFFDDNWNEEITEGDWIIDKWPDDFPNDLKDLIEYEVNRQIPHGCCGGCV